MTDERMADGGWWMVDGRAHQQKAGALPASCLLTSVSSDSALFSTLLRATARAGRLPGRGRSSLARRLRAAASLLPSAGRLAGALGGHFGLALRALDDPSDR